MGHYIVHGSIGFVCCYNDRSANSSGDDSDQVMLASRAGQMVDMLTSENRTLREELALASVKVARLQKVRIHIFLDKIP